MRATNIIFGVAMVAISATACSDSTDPDEEGEEEEEEDNEDVFVPPSFPKDGYCSEGTAGWAWCEDFDGQGVNSPVAFDPASSGVHYHAHSHMLMTQTTCDSSGDCAPFVQGGSLFLNAEDEGFGMDVLRIEQPFDFADREGHIHFRSDMKGHPRMHQAVHISPRASNTLPDLRVIELGVNMAPAISIDFVGDGGSPFSVTTWKNGDVAYMETAQGPFGIVSGDQHDIDIYVSRTNIRVQLDGATIFEDDFDDLGFDRGYVSFSQLAYNPVKDGYAGDNANTFMWDNLAFDGPSLAKNSLTPSDQQDVLFRAWSKATCTVRGITADGPVAPLEKTIFDTWHVRLPADAPPIAADEIQCTEAADWQPQDNQPHIGDIEVIRQ
jgi:hypothetical protein